MVNDLTGIGQVGSALIEAIRSATGVLYEPTRVKRRHIAEAKGKVEAEKLLALGEIENKEIVERAANRMFEKAVRQQENIEAVIEDAVPNLDEGAAPQGLDEDWLNQFVDHAEKVSNIDARSVWSKILAGEANAPGTYSTRTLNILASMSQSDAQLFQRLSAFTLGMNPMAMCCFVPKMPNATAESRGLNFNTLTHLENIGLINFNNLTGYVLTPSNPQNGLWVYNDGKRSVRLMPLSPGVSNYQFKIGTVLLTIHGHELMRVVEQDDKHWAIDYLQRPSPDFNWKAEVILMGELKQEDET